MRICQRRTAWQSALYFVRWQLWPVVLALPGHAAFAARGWGDRRAGVWRRAQLAAQLLHTHLAVSCAHTPLELLTIVEEILTLPSTATGTVVECGCYTGGSTAKLSRAAALVGRRLIVCDSFEGLPPVGTADQLADMDAFGEGDFASRLEDVQANVGRYGAPDIVDYVPGWYEDSLAQLTGTKIACLFLDVDLQESIKTCLARLWASITPGGKVFVHDVDRPPVVEPFRDAGWWASQVGAHPPEFVGAGRGLGWQRPLLGYAIKP